MTRTPFYLEDFGAVFKGVRVADVVDQADDVAGQVGIRQVVEVGEHFMKLRGTKHKDTTVRKNQWQMMSQKDG